MPLSPHLLTFLLLGALAACGPADPTPLPPANPPEAPGELSVALEASPQEGAAPLEVTFSATATAYTPDYLWDFGDGEGGYDAATVTHTYAAPGRYTALVSVGSSEDLVSDSVEITVR
jgi:PKD repeat protein